jgi:hypothetical protein
MPTIKTRSGQSYTVDERGEAFQKAMDVAICTRSFARLTGGTSRDKEYGGASKPLWIHVDDISVVYPGV